VFHCGKKRGKSGFVGLKKLKFPFDTGDNQKGSSVS
jgi:hypothetical protein